MSLSIATKVRLLAIGLLLAPLLAGAEPPASDLQTETLTIVFTETGFLGVNRTDVEAGYKALAEAVGRRRGYRVLTQVQSFREAEELEAILEADGAARLFAVNAWVFLEMDLSRLTPMFVGAVGGDLGRTYVLVTHRERGLDAPADLRGREIIVFEQSNAALGRHWLETLLWENELGDAATFFARTQYVHRPSAAVLPVFFGRAAAAVVDRAGFELMVEMNPQVGRNLQVITESEVMIDAIICLRNDAWPEGSYREDLIETLGNFHSEPAGKQILTFFKTDRLFPYREDLMDNARKLKAAHDRRQKGNIP